jgi:hypothetical protein
LLAQHQRRGGDLVGRFALDPQGGEERRGPGLVHAPGDEVAHGFRHPARGQVTPGQEGREHAVEPRGGSQLHARVPDGGEQVPEWYAARRKRATTGDFSLPL